MVVRIVPGEISAKDSTARVVLPTAAQPKFVPFERIAETISTPSRKLPFHKHEAAEVLTYIIEGSGEYDFAGAPPDPLQTGDVRLMSAPSTGAHAINPGKGQMIRDFAVVASIPTGSAPATVGSARVRESAPQPDGTATAKLLGPLAALKSGAGLECSSVRFVSPGTSFRRLGHGFTLIAYALSGRGRIDSEGIEGGEAAIVTDAAGFSIQGSAGFHAILVRAPTLPKPTSLATGPETKVA